MRPARVITGGQTGADQGALYAARACGIPTGGWAPQGWRTEDGRAPWLADFGLREHASEAYAPRTMDNVVEADFVLVVGKPSPGSDLTVRLARKHGKVWCSVLWAPGSVLPPGGLQLETMVGAPIPSGTWMLAGNRESVSPGIGAAVEAWLIGLWSTEGVA